MDRTQYSYKLGSLSAPDAPGDDPGRVELRLDVLREKGYSFFPLSLKANIRMHPSALVTRGTLRRSMRPSILKSRLPDSSWIWLGSLTIQGGSGLDSCPKRSSASLRISKTSETGPRSLAVLHSCRRSLFAS